MLRTSPSRLGAPGRVRIAPRQVTIAVILDEGGVRMRGIRLQTSDFESAAMQRAHVPRMLLERPSTSGGPRTALDKPAAKFRAGGRTMARVKCMLLGPLVASEPPVASGRLVAAGLLGDLQLRLRSLQQGGRAVAVGRIRHGGTDPHAHADIGAETAERG